MLVVQILLLPVMPVLCKGGGSNEIPQTEQDRALAEKAAEEYKIYREKYQPVMQKFIEDEVYFDPAVEDKLAGQTNADVMQKFSGATGMIDPATGQVSGGAGTVAADAQVKTRQAVRNMRVKGMAGMAEMGRTGATDVNTSMANLAKDSTKAAIDSGKASFESDVAKENATTSAMGSAGGMLAYNYNKEKI